MAREVFDCSRVYKNELERATKHAKVEQAKKGCAVELSVLGRKNKEASLQAEDHKPVNIDTVTLSASIISSTTRMFWINVKVSFF